MGKLIGIIAEDNSDVGVIEALVAAVAPHAKFSVKKHVGHGSGKIKSKCRQWAEDLYRNGCKALILVQDLDSKDHVSEERIIIASLKSCPIMKRSIIIPIQMIEAWLLADSEAIQRALNLRICPKPVSSPELLPDPKRKLEEMISTCSSKEKRYINTIHNPKIAREIDVSKLRACSSFRPLETFAKEIFA